MPVPQALRAFEAPVRGLPQDTSAGMRRAEPAAMSLATYRRKRDFRRTREPAPDAPAAAQRSIFVVQLHHARRRHYDLRLQVGGVLKSWAVPKGPSFDPAVKRLAAEVEDHPLAYAGFEGEIPAGEYGGGHVALYDEGVWATPDDAQQQLDKGHLRFELFGQRLKGSWHLVRTRRGRGGHPEWLLIKQEDAYAGKAEADDLLADVAAPPGPGAAVKSKKDKPAQKKSARKTSSPRGRVQRIDWAARAAALPGARKARLAEKAFAPELAMPATQVPPGEGWLHELKWDGYRLLAVIHAGKARLWSRNALEWTVKLPDIVAALERLGLDQAALDGELIAGAGAPADFSLLQSTLSGERQAPLAYVLFDLPHLAGYDLTRSPLAQRKTLLAALLEQPVAHLAYSSHIPDDGAAAFALAVQRGFEGIISKRADAPYRAGRGNDWRKIKRSHSDEYAVVGYTAPRGSRSGFGSLLLASPDGHGGWRYAGRVGSGFDEAQLRDTGARLSGAVAQPSVEVEHIDTDLRTARWFAPRFVVEVFSRGQGRQGLLRQPSLKALRMDKQPADLMRDSAAPAVARSKTDISKVKKATNARNPAKTTSATKSSSATARKKKSSPQAAVPDNVDAADFRLTSPEREVYPGEGISKQQVADYYAAMLPWLLPEITGRPLSLLRCPDGTGNECFFQKHRTAGIRQASHVRIKEESGATRDYLVVNDAAALMELVQFNALEFHPWGSSARAPGKATRLVFDLDPGPGVSWAAIKAAARLVRERLQQAGLESFVRTSGGKGLHVVAPLKPGCSWTLAKRFAHSFAASMAAADPDHYIATATKAKRDGRIFIDYLRNSRGATSVASYSLRARPGAPVAMPLEWSELPRLRSAAQFDIVSALAKVRRRKRDPWQGIDELEQDLSRWDAS
jgi:bifunctional non-homologous end joining protein LigD